ncbi:MAG: DNA replication and repair protein RecF [Actinomycetota bacterium]|nr:MAG: DNA replication and repair protein RecF [Actinomycetota bacterium]
MNGSPVRESGPASIAVRRVGAASLRRFALLSLPASPRVVLLGPNGTGKTTVLEAVHIGATTVSFRTRRVRDLVRRGESAARVRLGLGPDGGGRETASQEVVLAAGGCRYHRDGEEVRRMDLLGRVRVTPLLPGDLALVFGPPALRRRFLDLLVAQRDPSHGLRLLEVRRVERRRRRILAEGGRGLSPWNRVLAPRLAAVAAARREAAAALAAAARDRAAPFLPGGPSGRLSFRWDDALPEGPLTAEAVGEALEAVRRDELRLRRPKVSSAHCDLRIHLDGAPAGRTASQGEGRAVAIALRLAAADLLGGGVLLVDDVWGELDGTRRAALREAIAGARQAFLAACDEAVLGELLENARVFRLSADSDILDSDA